MNKLILILAGAFLISCNEKKADSEQKQIPAALENIFDSSFKNDTIYPKVSCRMDNSNSYSLLLPMVYDTISKSPVLFFIDAHADGLLPVEKYKVLANQFGYILIGNNNSKNGNSFESNSIFINQMMEDTRKRFSIDEKRIYVCGFSGGSRVAGYIAQNNPVVNGVIACGAGMQVNEGLASKHFIYIGIAGNEDFNFTEMKRTDAELKKTGIRHELLVFDGKHEWCPLEMMEEAITGLELDAMKLKTIPVDHKLIEDYILKSKTKTEELEKKKHPFELAHQLSKMINFLDGLTDVSEYKQKTQTIESSETYKFEAKSKTDAEAKEDALKNQYVQLLSDKDENWWSNEIISINKRIKSDINKEEVLIYKRILSYLSLAAFSYSNNAINQGKMDAAIHYLNLYKIIDPPNSEHSYMLAEVYAGKNDLEKCISYLNDAVKLGFKDISRMENDPRFNTLKNSQPFTEIVMKIKESNSK
jgi:hypothetical protein